MIIFKKCFLIIDTPRNRDANASQKKIDDIDF